MSAAHEHVARLLHAGSVREEARSTHLEEAASRFQELTSSIEAFLKAAEQAPPPVRIEECIAADGHQLSDTAAAAPGTDAGVEVELNVVAGVLEERERVGGGQVFLPTAANKAAMLADAQEQSMGLLQMYELLTGQSLMPVAGGAVADGASGSDDDSGVVVMNASDLDSSSDEED